MQKIKNIKYKFWKFIQCTRRTLKYYFYTDKKLEMQWNLYMGNFQKKPHKTWQDAEEILAYKAGWIKKLR